MNLLDVKSRAEISATYIAVHVEIMQQYTI